MLIATDAVQVDTKKIKKNRNPYCQHKASKLTQPWNLPVCCRSQSIPIRGSAVKLSSVFYYLKHPYWCTEVGASQVKKKERIVCIKKRSHGQWSCNSVGWWHGSYMYGEHSIAQRIVELLRCVHETNVLPCVN